MSQTGFGVPPRDSARRHAVFLFILTLAVASTGALCGPQNNSQQNTPQAKPVEITRERAIEIARARVRIGADNLEAVRTTLDGRPVWRVTFKRRQPDAPPGLYETHVIEIDALSGEVISAFMS